MGWEREQWIEEYEGGERVSEIARRHQISRKALYKWIERYEEEGLSGLQDRSRAPHHPARAMAEGVQELILAVKAKHSFWGARKIVGHLHAQSPEQDWPAVSSVGELLKQHGLTLARKRRMHPERAHHPLAHADQANALKNFLFTADGQKVWAEAGFRPVDPAVLANFAKDFPTPQKLWNIDDLGGWSVVDPALFDKDNGSITKIYKAATG